MNHVSIPKEPEESVQLRPLVDFREPEKIHRWTQKFLIDYWTAAYSMESRRALTYTETL